MDGDLLDSSLLGRIASGCSRIVQLALLGNVLQRNVCLLVFDILHHYITVAVDFYFILLESLHRPMRALEKANCVLEIFICLLALLVECVRFLGVGNG